MRRPHAGFSLIELVIFIVIVSVAVAGIMGFYVQSTAHSADPFIRQRTIAVASAYMDEILRKRWNENSPVGGGCVVAGGGACAAAAAAGIWTINTAYAAGAFVVPAAPDGCFYRTNGNGTSGGAAPAWPGTLGASVVDNTITWTCVAMTAAAVGPDGEARGAFDDIDDYDGLNEAPTDQINAVMPGYEAGYNVRVAVVPPAAPFGGIPAADVRQITVVVTNPLGDTFTVSAMRVNY